MNLTRKKASVAVIALALSGGLFFSMLPIKQAASLTGTDVLDRMDNEQTNAYLFGSMEMAAFLSHLQGNDQRSQCITDWYYKKGGVKQVVQALDHFKDHQAQPVIYALIQRACGK